MPINVTTARDYREIVEADLKDVLEDPDNGRRLIHAATTIYHLHEWLWAYQLNPNSPASVRGIRVRAKRNLVSYLDEHCPYFGVMQDLANGSKHALPSPQGRILGGFDEQGFDSEFFDTYRLEVDLGADAPSDRYIRAKVAVQAAGEYMIELAKELGA